MQLDRTISTSFRLSPLQQPRDSFHHPSSLQDLQVGDVASQFQQVFSQIDAFKKHWQGYQSQEQRGIEGRLTLTLDEAIGPSNSYVHINCEEVARSWQQLGSFELPAFLSRFSLSSWHVSTQEEWNNISDWKGESIVGVRFYVDGSSIYNADADARVGAAATVLIVDTPVGERFGGIQGRLVPYPATSPLAENWALLQAILWTISILNQIGNGCNIDISFYGDATGPGNFAQGFWTPQSHQGIADACRNLLFWNHERNGRECQWCHVRAHTGHPWNEAADTVAKAIVEGVLDVPCCVDLWNELSQQSERQWTWGWLWFLERMQWSADHALQLRNQGILYQLPVSDLESLNNLHLCRQGGTPPGGDASCSEGSFHTLTVATINVLSLFAGSDGSLHAGNYTSARMEAIATQCRQHSLDIVGLQETRHKADHYFDIPDFHVLTGATTPHYSESDEIAWSVDVNTHADILEERLRGRACAIQKVQRRRKVHLRDATWQLIQAKKCCWKNLKAVRQHRSRGLLREIFTRWRWQSSYIYDTGTFQPWLRWTDFEEARLMFLLRRFTREVTAAVRADDVAYYDDLAARAGTVDGEGGLKELWREIKATLPKALLRKKLNTKTQQPSDEELRHHFDQLEAGKATMFPDLVHQCVELQQSRRESGVKYISLKDFPSRLEVERLCGKVKGEKAPGMDAIPPSVVKSNPVEIGFDLFGLMFKTWASGEEPTSWKGGTLCPQKSRQQLPGGSVTTGSRKAVARIDPSACHPTCPLQPTSNAVWRLSWSTAWLRLFHRQSLCHQGKALWFE